MMAPRSSYRLPPRAPGTMDPLRRVLDLAGGNTGVSGGVDRGAPMAMGQASLPTGPLPGPGYDSSEGPGGFSGDLERPNFQETRPDGSVVETGPNTTNPGGTLGLEMGEGRMGDPGAMTGPAAGGGRRGWAGTSGTGLNLDMPGQRGGYGNLEGFNLDRAFAGGDENSVKDAFARWVTGLGFDPARASKEEIENILRANMDSAAEYGLNILDVNGENILIETAERGPEWVDVVRGAGAQEGDPDAAWQWGADPEGGGIMLDDGGGGMMGLPDLGGLPPELLEALGGDGDMLARIRAELDALVNGSASPLGQSAMTQQLRAL